MKVKIIGKRTIGLVIKGEAKIYKNIYRIVDTGDHWRLIDTYDGHGYIIVSKENWTLEVL